VIAPARMLWYLRDMVRGRISILLLPAASALLALASGCSGGKSSLERGLAKLKAGDDGAACARLQEAVQEDSSSVTAWCNLGVARWRAGEIDGAIEAFRRATDLTGDALVWEYLGRAYLASGRVDPALQALTKSQAGKPTAAGLTAMAVAEMKSGRAREAGVHLQAALSTDPGYPPALYNTAILYRDHMADPDTAETWFRRYVELAGDDAHAARAKESLAPFAAAESGATSPVEIAPPRQLTGADLLQRARERARGGDQDGATRLILDARRAEPRNPDILWEIVELYEKVFRQPDRARAAYSLFAREFPGDPRARGLAGARPAVETPREPVAPPHVRTEAAPPRRPSAEPVPGGGGRSVALRHWAEGFKFQRAGELDGAIAEYRKALKADETLASASHNLGLALKAKGDNAGASDAFAAAVKHQPDMVDARYMLAVCRHALGQSDVAALEARKVLAIDRGYSKAHLLLGVIHRSNGARTSAVKEFERFLELAPADPLAATVRQWVAELKR